MNQLPALALTYTMSLVLVAAVMDFFYRKVNNCITLPLIISGTIYQSAQWGVSGFLDSTVAVLVATGFLIIPFLMGGLGGGDVKLLAGVGAWVLLPDIVWIFIIAGLLAGVCGFALSLLKHRSLYSTMTEVLVLRYRMANVGAELDGEAWGKQKVTEGQPKRNLIPFALLIAIGTMLRFFIVYRWN
jgi:prepilin peptidase CpaA